MAGIALGYYLWQSNLDPSYYYTGAWILAVFVLLGIGNRFIANQLDRHFPWLRYGNVRFFVHLFLGILYSLVVVNLAYFTFKILFTTTMPTQEQFVVMNVYGLVIFVPVFSIYFSLQFLQQWKRSELNVEKFKKENIRSRLESLKNHLDPHFLFNNLNILSSLIDKDRAMSKAFLDNFAEVYRTILKSKDEDLILVSEELEFINSYVALLKTRFEEHIIFKIDVSPVARHQMIPPLTLQMLIENAIKHNIISEKRPLYISVASKDGYLQVTNTLNEKPEELKDRTGSGLDNIKRRYEYFTENEIRVDKTGTDFTVAIPLLEVDLV